MREHYRTRMERGLDTRIEVVADERDKFLRAATDGVAMRVGLDVRDPAPGAEEVRTFTLFELAEECLRRVGQPYDGSKEEVITRAMTSSDFPKVLANVANKSLVEGYRNSGETWPVWCDTGSASNFKDHYIYRPADDTDLDRVPEGGKIPQSGFHVERGAFRIATYGRIFKISRKAIINDDLNVLSQIPKVYGEATARTVGDVVYNFLVGNPVMDDGEQLFSSAHNNLAPSGSEPTYDALKQGIQAMLSQKDAAGKRRLHIRPRYLLTPIAHFLDASEISDLQYIAEADTGIPMFISSSTQLIPIAEGRLDDAGSAWYLAGPKGKTVTVFFLDGQKVPKLEVRKGFSMDGVEFKVLLDFGVTAVDWRALYKNPGA